MNPIVAWISGFLAGIGVCALVGHFLPKRFSHRFDIIFKSEKDPNESWKDDSG